MNLEYFSGQEGQYLILAIASVLVIFLIFGFAIVVLERRGHPLSKSFRGIRTFVVPTAAFLLIALFVYDVPRHHRLVKILESLFWIEVIWLTTNLLTVALFRRAGDKTWRARVPNLFLDLARVGIVIIGAALVIAGVWDRNLGGFLATLGLGSIVLGLALQDTLGNLFAGIALLFERPFAVGDWIRVGDTTGEIVEMNWRAVRLRTRDLDLVVVPNSIMGKDRLQNFSRPTEAHGTNLLIDLPYNEPPNKVRKILMDCIRATPGIISSPRPRVRTKRFNESSIAYECRFFISDYYQLPEIEQDFMTRVWYAAKRNRLVFPYPVRTVYKTEVPTVSQPEAHEEIEQTLRSIPIFEPLDRTEFRSVANDAAIQWFGKGETIVRQDELGSAMYVIKSGSASISVRDPHGRDREVNRLTSGQFFGEMALLCGEARSATVTALDDLETIVIYQDALAELLKSRPELAQQMADIAQARKQNLSDFQEASSASLPAVGDPATDSHALVKRIKRFFGV